MSPKSQRWIHTRGDLAADGWESVIDERTPGWAHTGIRVAQLMTGQSLALETVGVERIVVPLTGSFSVTHSDGDTAATTELSGRQSPFDGPTDVLYLSAASTASLSGTGRVAVASSPTTDIYPTRYIAAAQIPIELRGAGASSRQVHNFGTPSTLDAARLIVCEVITPAGNWSSYPPHKHDQAVPGYETRLEEIYYFETASERGEPGDERADPFGMFSAYSSPAGEIDINAMVRSGDIALVPHGYHGPAVAPPGYDLYYLNVMAGPGPERDWLISDDPCHAWIRRTWTGQDVDPRLPYATELDDEGRHS